jgi:PadR family transcriptional regulator PadR
MPRSSKPSPKPGGEARRKATREAVAHATRTSAARDAAKAIDPPQEERRGARGLGGDPFTGQLRKREVLPLLVLHFIQNGPSYGNQLMERISSVTEGVLSVNPNTMYPLLRQLESRGLIEGRWEHPERRSRRYYSLTEEGEQELERLVREVRPFLDSVARSIEEIAAEVYGDG